LSEDDPSEGAETLESGAKGSEEPLAPASAPAPPLSDVVEPPPDSDAAQAYHRRARLAEDRLAEVLAAYRDLKKENEAHRERTTRNIERRFDHRRERLLLRFIDILDNLDRALEAAETSYAGEPLIEGLILVRTQLLQTLKEEGLERIPVIGLPYDPNFSEVVEMREVEDPEHNGVVVKELMRGYRLSGKVARVSRVVVGTFPGAAATASPAAPAASPETPPAPPAAPPASTDGGSGESLDEIIARAQAREPAPADASVVEPEPEGEDVRVEEEMTDPESGER
jgi:molecular chaperone GrpE